MIKETVTIINELGLHARASAKLVKVTSRHSCRIYFCIESKCVDAKSIMGLMMLAATKGTELELVVDGEDEAIAAQEILDLINNKFGEED
jgi:phosphocarrier protein HPr